MNLTSAAKWVHYFYILVDGKQSNAIKQEMYYEHIQVMNSL